MILYYFCNFLWICNYFKMEILKKLEAFCDRYMTYVKKVFNTNLFFRGLKIMYTIGLRPQYEHTSHLTETLEPSSGTLYVNILLTQLEVWHLGSGASPARLPLPSGALASVSGHCCLPSMHAGLGKPPQLHLSTLIADTSGSSTRWQGTLLPPGCRSHPSWL